MRQLVLSSVLVVAVTAGGCGKGGKGGKGKGSGSSVGGSEAAVPVAASVRDSTAFKDLRLDVKVAPLPQSEPPSERMITLHKAANKGSWRVHRPVAVYAAPSAKADIVGGIAQGVRLPRVKRLKSRDDTCPQGFVALGPKAYACAFNLRVDRRPPRARRRPTLGANKLTPGTYGYIRTGGTKLYPTLPDGFADSKGVPIAQSDTVRWAGKRHYKGKKFWRISHGQFIRGDRVRRFWPSYAQGVDLLKTGADRPKLPLVFMVGVRRRKIGEKLPPIGVHGSPGGKGVSTLKRYTAWSVSDIAQLGGRAWYRIAGKGWVSSEMVRLAKLTDPPKGLQPGERWLDVDADEQTLVAYRGRRPVFTSLVAAGVWKFPSPPGVYRVYKKMAEADMRAEPAADEQYRVDHVPWTLYFKRGYAVHGAYWHDGFGHARSHGCINLSPRDAAVVYHFARPALPDGWTMIKADAERPGTLIRVRYKKPPKWPPPKPKKRPAAMRPEPSAMRPKPSARPGS